MKKNKHDHKGTKALKTALFAVLMCFPLLAIGSSILINTFNQNAKIDNAPEYEYKAVETENDLILGKEYIMTASKTLAYTETSTQHIILYISDAKVLTSNQNIKEVINNTNKIMLYRVANQQEHYITVYFYNENTFLLQHTTNDIQLEFILENYSNVTNQKLNYFKYALQEKIYNQITPNTDVFYYATNKVFNSNLFNWTNTTPIKTPITAFTNVFGIEQENIINNLLVYWLSVTGIYIVIDIIIETFVFITHLLNKNGEL